MSINSSKNLVSIKNDVKHDYLKRKSLGSGSVKSTASNMLPANLMEVIEANNKRVECTKTSPTVDRQQSKKPKTGDLPTGEPVSTALTSQSEASRGYDDTTRSPGDRNDRQRSDAHSTNEPSATGVTGETEVNQSVSSTNVTNQQQRPPSPPATAAAADEQAVEMSETVSQPVAAALTAPPAVLKPIRITITSGQFTTKEACSREIILRKNLTKEQQKLISKLEVSRGTLTVATQDQVLYDHLRADWNSESFGGGASFAAERQPMPIKPFQHTLTISVDPAVDINDPEVQQEILAQGYLSAVRKQGKSNFNSPQYVDTPIVILTVATIAEVIDRAKSKVRIGCALYRVTPETRPHQCHKCQEFGHSRGKCRNPLRCLKCSGAHNRADCKSQREKCANCGGKHVAVSRSCPKMIEESKRLLEKLLAPKSVMPMSQPRPAPPPTSNSWANPFKTSQLFNSMAAPLMSVNPTHVAVPPQMETTAAEPTLVAGPESEPRGSLVAQPRGSPEVTMEQLYDKINQLTFIIDKMQHTINLQQQQLNQRAEQQQQRPIAGPRQAEQRVSDLTMNDLVNLITRVMQKGPGEQQATTSAASASSPNPAAKKRRRNRNKATPQTNNA